MLDTPVIVLNGARQVGKSTLMQSLVNASVRYYTLDDPATRSAVQRDPHGFIAAQTGPVLIDEVQRAPEIFLAIKLAVDQHRKPGQFLLSGSVNVMMLPQLADSLAGRVEIITLWPLAQAEVSATAHNFIDDVFADPLEKDNQLNGLQAMPAERSAILAMLLAGGYPEAMKRRSERRRSAWFESYSNTVLQRDVRELAQIDGLTQMPRLFAHLAHRACGPLNTADVSRSIGMPQTTLKRYLTLLQTVYFIHLLPAWSPRESHRAQKTPKLFFNDSGLLAHTLNMTTRSIGPLAGIPGHLLETWVFNELCKHQGWADTPAELMHYRTSTGAEVDFILQDRQGRIVGIEVKATMQVGSNDFKGLRHLRELLGSQFHRGIVLHPGVQTVAFDTQLAAVPLAAMWQ
jgi:predicted AAA+ superfamily ATPase